VVRRGGFFPLALGRRFLQLLAWEPQEPRARWEPWIRAGYVVFAIAFSLTVVVDAFAHETVMLGLGLVDEPGSALTRLESQLAGVSPRWRVTMFPLAAFVLAWNGLMLYRDFARAQGLPRRQIVSFFLLTMFLSLMLYVGLAIVGSVSAAMGYGFLSGFSLVRHYTVWCGALVTRVPTLTHLPYPLPLLASIVLVDFFQYWFHRLGHTWRPFWLLWHRPHHMPPFLTIPTTQPVLFAQHSPLLDLLEEPHLARARRLLWRRTLSLYAPLGAAGPRRPRPVRRRRAAWQHRRGGAVHPHAQGRGACARDRPCPPHCLLRISGADRGLVQRGPAACVYGRCDADEVFHGRRHANRRRRFEPRARYSAKGACAAPWAPARAKIGARLELVATPFRGARHLAQIAIRRGD
jgi:hypothetical protein